ncbi:MAG: glycoside hydrolase family 5 protein [Vulcanimicrobiaceae bacterium]
MLHGVDRSGTEYACVQNFGIFDGPNDQTSVAAIASWHTNAVRVPLNEDCWLAINGVNPAYAGANYQTAIVDYVDLLNANGLIAILDLHWNAPGTQSATGQEPMADADHAPAFWSSVAATFKSNSSVMFDLYNEPYVASWSCWRDGGSASACGTPFAIAGMNALIAAVRSTGASNIVLAGGLAYANDLSGWLQNEPSDPSGNLVASWHSYNFNTCDTTSCFDSTVAPVAAVVPVVAGEIGETTARTATSIRSWPGSTPTKAATSAGPGMPISTAATALVSSRTTTERRPPTGSACSNTSRR